MPYKIRDRVVIVSRLPFPDWVKGEIIGIEKIETCDYNYDITVKYNYILKLDTLNFTAKVEESDLMLEEVYNKKIFHFRAHSPS